MTRWRLATWLPDRRNVVLRKHWTGSCKLCAIDRCMRQALSMDTTWNLPPGTVEWKVERLSRVIDGWEIVTHSGVVQGREIRHHAHR